MQFGICTAVENSEAVKNVGWDFVEENVQGFLQGTLPDHEWAGEKRAAAAKLPILAANGLVPGAMKITGPDVSPEKLKAYMTNVCRRAGKVGMKRLVFGSGAARQVPEGFDRKRAREQILDFLRMCAPLAQESNVMIVVEHLNSKECNIITTLAEELEYVKTINHPNIRCLADSWHFWLENESLDTLREAMPFLHHVHVADKDGRVAPGEAGTSDYRPFFKVLKQGGYKGGISVEASNFTDYVHTAPRVLAFLKQQWEQA